MRKNPEARFSEEYLLPDIKHVGFRALGRAGWRAIVDVIRNIPRGILTRHYIRKLVADNRKNKNVPPNSQSN
jgi:hypothetical protein